MQFYAGAGRAIAVALAVIGWMAIGQAGREAQAGTIELWSFISPTTAQNVRSQSLARVIDDFEKANPGMQVKTQVIEWSQIGPSLLRASRSGRVPDVVMLYSPLLGMQVAAKTLQPLDRYLSKWDAGSRADLIVFPTAKDQAGSTFAVPWEMRVFGLAYRKDMLDAVGLKPPATMAELGEISARFSKDGISGFGFAFSPAHPVGTMEWFIPALVGLGAKILKPDGTADFESVAAERLIAFIRDFVVRDKLTPIDVALQGDDDLERLMLAGKVLFLPKGTHRIDAMRSRGLGEKLGWMPYPGFGQGKGTPAFQAGWTLAIPVGSRNSDEAWKLIEHWISPETQAKQLAAAGYLPVRRSVGTSPAVQQSGAEYVRLALDYAAANPLDFDWPENTEKLFRALAAMMEQILTGRMPTQAALKWAEREYNSSLGK